MCDLDDLDPDPEPDPITDNALWGGQSWREPLLLTRGRDLHHSDPANFDNRRTSTVGCVSCPPRPRLPHKC